MNNYSHYFLDSPHIVNSSHILYTPSSFADTSLIHLQETGTLQALHPYKSGRSGLNSCLFFAVTAGEGKLVYDGQGYNLTAGDCVFIDCRKEYCYETGEGQPELSAGNLWSLQWCHFYGPNMNAIYRKYRECGGCPVFRPEDLSVYRRILGELYEIAGSDDPVRDMRIHEKLSSLLTALMEGTRQEGSAAMSATGGALDVQAVKDYLDDHFTEKLTLDALAGRFFINKYYLLSLFKERFGVTVNVYLNQVRVNYVRQQLRFSDKTVEMIARELGLAPAYLSRLFKKTEGMTPSEYRRNLPPME